MTNQETKELFEFIRANNPNLLSTNVNDFFGIADCTGWLWMLSKSFKKDDYQHIVEFDGLWIENYSVLGDQEISTMYGLGIDHQDSEYFKFFVSEVHTFVHHKGEKAVKLDIRK